MSTSTTTESERGTATGTARGVVLLNNPEGVVLLRENTAGNSSDGTSTLVNEINPQQLYFPLHPPPIFVPFADGNPSSNRNTKSVWQRFKWVIVIGGVVVLAAIIAPIAILVSINSRTLANGNGGPGTSATPTTTTSLATSTTSANTQTNTAAVPSGTVGTVYPTTLSNGAILIDPIIKPANNPARTYNLAPLQDSVAVFPDSGYEYHVVFGRSLSISERKFPNPPYLFNYCAQGNVVLCILEVNLVLLNPNAYGIGVVTSSSSAAVSVNGTDGLQLTFGAQTSVFCNRQATIVILCSATVTGSAPTFVRAEVTEDKAANLCNHIVYFSHSAGCPA
ncbi:hypothetical protein BJ742DRAFT_858604 [Cladochytrium replicatum]|nr:hypothetical protein BJ742DRAFT_858604 [Cladochytrium replicatum]